MNVHYPTVLDEDTTLDRLHAGWSIARYGDGEFKLATGSPNNVSQVNSPKLTAELLAILESPPDNCIIGIPDMNPELPKAHIWRRYMLQYTELLDQNKAYGSAFITRPDSAPRIDTKEYFDKMEALWKHKRVTLVGNDERSLTKKFLEETGAQWVNLVKCAYRDAYADIDRIADEVRRCANERVIICAGAMGTCLAARLARLEYHALDLGHIGLFWRGYAK